MRKTYRRYIKFLEDFLCYNNYFKMYLAEHYALLRKKKLIKNAKWSEEQKDEFNSYWKANYKKITNKGNRLIESFNGTYDYRYIPDFLYATKIEHQFNSFLHSKIYSDKSLTEVLYKGKSKAILPKTYLLNSGGYFYNENREVIGKDGAIKILQSVKEAVIKPTLGGNSGKGIIIDSFDENCTGKETGFELLSLINDENYVVQEIITQSKELNTLYPHSVNTFRVISFISNGKVNIAPISLRMGADGKKVDNIHAGGLSVGISNSNETILKYGYKLGYSDQAIKYESHPDTNIKFKGFKIPGIKDIVESAIILHGFTPHTGIISWDFTINEKHKPVLIEANYIGQAVWLSQIVNGYSIFMEETEDILKRIKG